mmetsp:Transcript_77814/g.172388  ORF Transcript_77814/g.172388 Transcript_77814/m.172388 type:complete len:751 (+) Transcript_77814:101-2353(+)
MSDAELDQANEASSSTGERSWPLPGQRALHKWYTSDPVEWGVAAVIFVNFLISTWDAQKITQSAVLFDFFEILFNAIFTLELIVNFYANYFVPFWRSAWNIFDVFVVTISWLSLLGNTSGLNVLRLFRAFRVFRLLKRIEALQLIVLGVTKSLPGVANACMLLGLTMGIWSIIGVHQFGDDYPNEFGTFFLAWLTCFQLMTFDGWASSVARPVIMNYSDWIPAVYFISYALVNAVILTNVVMAILLDSFTEEKKRIEHLKELKGLEAKAAAEEHLKAEEQLKAEDPNGQLNGQLNGQPHGLEGAQDDVNCFAVVSPPSFRVEKYMVDMETRLNERVERIAMLCQVAASPGRMPISAQLEEILSEHSCYQPKSQLLETLRAQGLKEATPAMADLKSRSTLTDSNYKELLWKQRFIRRLYDSTSVQIVVAAIIGCNFLISAVEAQIMPAEGSGAAKVFALFEVVFNVFFLVELGVNIYARFFVPFWLDPWNIFDFVIVIISWVSMLGNAPGLTVLRLLRAFRVFRLFRRIESLRIIMMGVLKSLPGVFHAFTLLALIMGIWSIIGVHEFGDKFERLFGNFGRAMLTMLQIMSFDSWCSGIARDVVLASSGFSSCIAFVFFVAYVFISGLVMINVVLAILLDNFLVASQQVRDEIAEIKRQDQEAMQKLKEERDMSRRGVSQEQIDASKVLESMSSTFSDSPALVKLVMTEWRVTSALVEVEAKTLARARRKWQQIHSGLPALDSKANGSTSL